MRKLIAFTMLWSCLINSANCMNEENTIISRPSSRVSSTLDANNSANCASSQLCVKSRVLLRTPRHFSREEDEMIVEFVANNPDKNWSKAKQIILGRTARQIKERWKLYLEPSLRCEPWTEIEDNELILHYEQFGPKWNIIAQRFCGKSQLDVKNRYHYLIFTRRRLKNI